MLADGFHDVASGKLAMVVTYLEMHARADTREVVLPDGVTFRQVAPTVEWYRDIFTRVGALDWLWYGRLRLSDTDLSSILEDKNVHFYTLAVNGTDEALLELDFREDGACELAYFGLTSKLIGAGAGRYLMNEAITRAWNENIKRFHVHTCTLDSPQALNFYIRSGFTPYKRAIEIDDDPRLIGVLPDTAASQTPII